MAFLLSASCTHCKSRTCHCPAKEADLTNSPARADAGDAAPMRPKPVVNRVEEPQCPAGWKAPEETAQAHRIAHAFLPFPWKVRAVFRAGARITARPARLAGDRWILADHRGRVRAIDIRKANGRWSLQEAWKAQLPDIVWSAPKVSADGRSLWVGCDDDSVYRLDAATGKVLGQVRPFECTFTRKNDPEATRCDVDNEFVLLPDASVLAGGGGIARILPDGTIAWRFPVTSHVRGAPAVDGEGHLYFSTLGGEIVSLDAQGALRWRERVRSRCDSTPVLAGGCLVILGCDDSSLNAFSTLDGRPVWKLFAPGAFRGAGALSPDGSVLYWGASIATCMPWRRPRARCAGAIARPGGIWERRSWMRAAMCWCSRKRTAATGWMPKGTCGARWICRPSRMRRRHSWTRTPCCWRWKRETCFCWRARTNEIRKPKKNKMNCKIQKIQEILQGRNKA